MISAIYSDLGFNFLGNIHLMAIYGAFFFANFFGGYFI